MKKMKFWIVGLLFVPLAGLITIRTNVKYDAKADRNFILTNMEALAQGEGPLENDCLGSGSVSCGGGYYKTKYSR